MNKRLFPLADVKLPIESLEELGDNLFVLRGGYLSTSGEDSGCGCGCNCSSGKDCGCGCGGSNSSSGKDCGCGCGCNSSSNKDCDCRIA